MAQARFLSEPEHELVSGAVAAAEANSAGEIVTILAERSDDYADVALAWSILVAFLALTLLALASDFYLGLLDRVLGAWGMSWTPHAALALAATVAMAKFAAMWLLQLWPRLRLLLVPGPLKEARVRARAIAAFRIGAERRTHGRTGILIYLSMAEHRAEIVADEAITSKVSGEVWGEAMAAMIARLKQGQTAEGLVAAVERVGAVLAEHLPRTTTDLNELPDKLIEV